MTLEPTPIGTPIPLTEQDSLETVDGEIKPRSLPTWLIPLGIGAFLSFCVFGLIGTLLFIARENEWKERLNQPNEPTKPTQRDSFLQRK